MGEENRYNGWTNYETWNVNLWITNEQGSDSYWREEAQEAYDRTEAEKGFTHKEKAALELAEVLKEAFEENNPLKGNFSTYGDLLNAALSEVNWYEIAEAFLEDVAEPAHA